MKEWRERGIVLRLGHFGESHIWLRILFPGQGLQTVFAFGGARSRKRFCGCLDFFNLLDCYTQESRAGYICLQEAELVQGGGRLRNDWRLARIAASCALFAEASGIAPESASEAFTIFQSLRIHLENAANCAFWLASFFRLRLVSCLGLAPALTHCGSCAAPLAGGYFLPAQGHAVCGHCATDLEPERQIPVSSAALQCLSQVQTSLPHTWSSLNPAPADLDACVTVIDAFVAYHLDVAKERTDAGV